MTSSLRYLSKISMIRSAYVLTSLLILMLQGSSGGHMLLVEHTRCAEHGELVHGDAHQHGAGPQQQAESPSLHGMPDPSTEEGHDHCSVSSDRRDALVLMATADAGIQASKADEPLRLRSAVIPPITPRFRIAPKNSPPA